MLFTAKIVRLGVSQETLKARVMFEADSKGILPELEGLIDKVLSVDVKQLRQKRSLNSNNYAWYLITEIANILRSDKEKIYLEMLKRYGQSQMISVYADVDVSKFLKYYELDGETELNGRLYKHYKVYTGSSEMDTKEMSILIDGIVLEAKELGIETMSDLELKSLKESWK